MEYLKVKANRNLECDHLAGILFPIEKGTLLGLKIKSLETNLKDKAKLKILPAGNLITLPFTHFRIPYRGNDYGIFLTERSFNTLILYASTEIADRLEYLIKIQARAPINKKVSVLKVQISDGVLTKKLVPLTEIEPLF
jgi:hypothetical protein